MLLQNQPITSKWPLTAVILVLAAIFIFGLKWVFEAVPLQAPFLLFSYAVGLTMIFLPCTLPLAFVIVPLSMGKNVKKGIGIALAFSVGVIITLSIYGALIGFLGNALGVGRVETAKNILYALAGILGIAIALGELELINFKMPMYSGGGPGFIQRQGDFFKAFLLGLFLGNIGVGCPNPLFNAVILPQIVVEASAYRGFLIMFIHALGRVTPLLLIAFLAILGVNATGFLVRHKDRVVQVTAWAMIFVGGFLFMIGAFGHDGYTYSGIHSYLEKITQEEVVTNILGREIKTLGHGHDVPVGDYLPYAPWVMLFLWLAPIWWWYSKEKSKLTSMSLWFLVMTSVFLIVIFGWALPHQFLYHSGHTEMPLVLADIKNLETLKPKAPVNFEINIKPLAGAKIDESAYEYSHERLIHIVVIHENLDSFVHFHPEDQVVITHDMLSDGIFPFTLAFPKDGRYIMAINFKYKGEEAAHHKVFDVGERKANIFKKDLSQNKKFDGYDVSFNAEPKELVFGTEARIKYHFEKLARPAGGNGKPVVDLEPYLGAPMHFAIVSADFSSFAHTHGELSEDKEANRHGLRILPEALAHMGEEEDSRKDGAAKLPNKLGPDIFLHYTFPHPGIYAVFGEAKHQGKVILTKFMVEVGVGQNRAMSVPHGH